jgi:hypothetical protein
MGLSHFPRYSIGYLTPKCHWHSTSRSANAVFVGFKYFPITTMMQMWQSFVEPLKETNQCMTS